MPLNKTYKATVCGNEGAPQGLATKKRKAVPTLSRVPIPAVADGEGARKRL